MFLWKLRNTGTRKEPEVYLASDKDETSAKSFCYAVMSGSVIRQSRDSLCSFAVMVLS
jgi:hypothetical protein